MIEGDRAGLQAFGPADVHVWCRRSETMGEPALAAARATLSRDEQARADRFHFAADRRDFIAAHDLLRRSLSRVEPRLPEEWLFEVEPGGRPRVCADGERAAGPLGFSLSHTRGLVACATAHDRDVGVDIERGDRPIDVDDLARTVMSPDERRAIQRVDEPLRQVRLVELWTLKEAYAKAVGLGLATDLSVVSFEWIGEGRLRFAPDDRSDLARWQFAVYAPWGDLGSRMAVAVKWTDGPRRRFVARLVDEDIGAALPPRSLSPLWASG